MKRGEEMANSEKLVRLLKIISLIEQRNGADLQTLADECEVCQRTIYRDVEALSMGGMPIHWDPDSKRYRFSKKVFLKPLTFSVDEATALLHCITAFTREKTPLTPALRLAQERMMSSLPSERQKKVDELKDIIDIKIANKPHDVCSDTFSCVEKAIQEKKRLEVQYYTKSSETLNSRKLDPYVITFRGKAWYLIAFCHLRGAIKIFRLDRIRQIKILPETYTIPRNFSAAAFFEGSWLLEQGDPVKVRLRFYPEAARWVREGDYHTSERTQEMQDGSLLYEVTVSGTREITRWILSFGPSVEVLEPESLRTEIASICGNMKVVYEDKVMG
jgi:predicted DNA-binding transcriptional regulator YafY